MHLVVSRHMHEVYRLMDSPPQIHATCKCLLNPSQWRPARANTYDRKFTRIESPLAGEAMLGKRTMRRTDWLLKRSAECGLSNPAQSNPHPARIV